MNKAYKAIKTILVSIFSILVMCACSNNTTKKKTTSKATSSKENKTTEKKSTTIKKTTEKKTTTDSIDTDTFNLVITVDDSMDTDTLKNTVKVTDSNNKEFVNGADVPKSSEITVRLFNLASDCHIQVKVDDFELYEWTYFEKLTGEDVGVGNLILDGQLINSDTLTIEVKTGIIPLNNYTVTYESTTGVIFDVYILGGELGMDKETITSGSSLEEGSVIEIDVENKLDKDISVIIFIDNKPEKVKTIKANYKTGSAGIFSTDGLYNNPLNGDMVITFEDVTDVDVNIKQLDSTTIKVYDMDSEKYINNGETMPKYNLFKVEIQNNTDDRILANIDDGNNKYVIVIVPNDSYESDSIFALDDISVETLELTGYNITIDDSQIDEDYFGIYFYYYFENKDEESYDVDKTDIIPTTATLYFSAYNLYDSPCTLTIDDGIEKIDITIPVTDGDLYLSDDITITSDVIITVKN